MKEDAIRRPIELIDEDLDVVVGGFVFINDLNIADIDQSIRQFAVGALNLQAAANEAVVAQSS